MEKAIKVELERVTPIREKNIENLSKIQRLNLELKGIDEENKIEYVENKCTKMEYQKYFLKVRQAFPVLSD